MLTLLGLALCVSAIFVGTRGDYTTNGLAQAGYSLAGIALAVPGVALALFG